MADLISSILNHRVVAILSASGKLFTGFVGVPIGYVIPATPLSTSIVTRPSKLAYSISGSCCTVESTRLETELIIVTLKDPVVGVYWLDPSSE